MYITDATFIFQGGLMSRMIPFFFLFSALICFGTLIGLSGTLYLRFERYRISSRLKLIYYFDFLDHGSHVASCKMENFEIIPDQNHNDKIYLLGIMHFYPSFGIHGPPTEMKWRFPEKGKRIASYLINGSKTKVTCQNLRSKISTPKWE